MKKISIFLIICFLFFSCDVFEGCEKGISAIGSKIHSNNLNWEEHFDITWEELKLKHEGTYQTESEVWYKGEYKVLTFYLKMNEKLGVRYQTGECGDLLTAYALIQTNNSILNFAECNKKSINTIIDPTIDEFAMMNSEYLSMSPEGIEYSIPIKKISNEYPAELNWEYTECNKRVTGICE